ncbi:MAG TPA: flagellar basal body-associated FliL family protein [Gemmatirosa sp.]
MILAIVAGLALGGGAGAFGVGPALASGIAPSAPAVHAKHHAKSDKGDEADADSSDADAADDEGDSAPAEKKGGKEGAASSVYTIDNLVLNPAGSGGTRFLLLSIAFEMKDAAALEAIKTRDAELRDAVLVTLGAKTVEQLSDMVSRDSLKVELRAATAKALHTRGVRRVYFPQFVIQ